MFTSFENCQPIEILPGFVARFIHTNSQTFSWVEIAEGSVLPEHFHINEQVSRVMKGSFELNIDGIKKICTPGDMALIKSNVPHAGVALTNCIILDIFTPFREDYQQLSVSPKERRK